MNETNSETEEKAPADSKEKKPSPSNRTRKTKGYRGRRPSRRKPKEGAKEKDLPVAANDKETAGGQEGPSAEDAETKQTSSATPPAEGKPNQKEAITAAAKKPKRGPAAKKAKKPAKKTATKKSTYKLLINTDEPEECRIVLLEDGKVESFHVETITRVQAKGNIYKAKITAVEPNLHAAFVDFGTGKNGFLPFSDIHPEYYYAEIDPNTHWKDLNIQDVIRKGQEVLVEVVKEPTGNKGANMTTYLSIPGRYLVLMPGSDSHGISRKLDDEERARLREIMGNINLPEGIGYIIRTASQSITKTALNKDLRYLINLWKEIKKRGQTMPAPSLIYKEQNIIARFLRDHFSSEIQEILVDSPDAFKQVQSFLDLLPAKQKTATVKLHKEARPIFNLYNVEEQIEQIYQQKVNLPSGGSIVISPTEALVAIDVNSGRTSKDKNFEESIFLANMEAAEELARQLRLRDLGGLIVVDFIDMRVSKHVREVEKKVKASMKKDKAKVDISRISKFGLMQISRQRLGPPVQSGSYIACEHCQGRGVVQSVETLSLSYLRRIQTGVTKKNVKKAKCCFPMAVTQYLLNKKRADLAELENRYQVEIIVKADPDMRPSDATIEFLT